MNRIVLGSAILLLTVADVLAQAVFLDNRSKSRIELLIDGTPKCTALVQTHDGTKNAGWCQVSVPEGVHKLTARWPNGQTKDYPNVTVPKGKIVTLTIN